MQAVDLYKPRGLVQPIGGATITITAGFIVVHIQDCLGRAQAREQVQGGAQESATQATATGGGIHADPPQHADAVDGFPDGRLGYESVAVAQLELPLAIACGYHHDRVSRWQVDRQVDAHVPPQMATYESTLAEACGRNGAVAHRERLQADAKSRGEVERVDLRSIVQLCQRMIEQLPDDRGILMTVQPENQASPVVRDASHTTPRRGSGPWCQW